MGHSTIIDILASFCIAGAVLLMIIKLNATVSNSLYTTSNDLVIESNMTTIVRIIENDFRKIGYCADPQKVPDPLKSIIAASLHSIKFTVDTDNNGTIDTITYSIGDTTTCSETPNRRDFLLYRTVNNNAPRGYSLGLTKFDFLFYNSLADSLSFPVTVPSQVHSMRLTVLLESPYGYDTTYAYSYWRQLRLAARNLRNR